MSALEERFDGMFLTIAQQSQGIEPLLDNLFSFLRRKTDFYSGASPAMVEELVLRVVRKHAALAEKAEVEKRKLREKEEQIQKKKLEDKKKKEEEEARVKAQKISQEDGVLEVSEDGSFDTATVQTKPANPTPVNESKPTELPAETAENPAEASVDDEDDDSPPPTGNGGKTETYVWTQQLAELTVSVPVPAGTKTKQLDVQITNKHLKVGLKGQKPFIDGDFHKKIIVDDSFWTLEDSDVVINIQKENKMEWWKCVITGDPEINTRKVQPENSKLSDLDGETRQTVEKMMFDQRQKALGLPSADELQKREMLEKFMKSHPEMDFSQAKFT